MKRVAVIGAGITGLCAAHELQKHGCAVTVLERSDRVGGAICSKRVNGYLLELGPNTVLGGGPIWDELMQDLQLTPQMANPQARKRYLVRDGKLRAIPVNPFALMSTPILSFSGKCRVLREPFVRRRNADSEDESLADFIRRRFGAEFLTYVIDPAISGIYTGSPEKLSTRHTLPFLWNLEGEGSSVIGGMLKKLFARRRQQPRVRRRMVSFANGLAELPQTLAQKLGSNLRLNSAVNQVLLQDGEWRLAIKGSSEWLTVDEVVETVPLPELGKAGNDGLTATQLAELAAVPYASVRVVHVGLELKAVPHPLDGFGFLLPQCENRELLGVLFSSSIFPDRAPQGKALLTIMLGGSRALEVQHWNQAQLQEVIRAALRQYLHVSGEYELLQDTLYPAAIPQFPVGYSRVLAQFAELENHLPGLHFAGSFRGGISVLNCLENGVRLGRELAARIS